MRNFDEKRIIFDKHNKYNDRYVILFHLFLTFFDSSYFVVKPPFQRGVNIRIHFYMSTFPLINRLPFNTDLIVPTEYKYYNKLLIDLVNSFCPNLIHAHSFFLMDYMLSSFQEHMELYILTLRETSSIIYKSERNKKILKHASLIRVCWGNWLPDVEKYLKGVECDMINTIMAAVAFNMMKKLRQIRGFYLFCPDLLTGYKPVNFITVLIYWKTRLVKGRLMRHFINLYHLKL